jgi:hypothetical protein
MLTAGQGYWVRLSQAGTLRIPAGSAIAQIAEASSSLRNQQVERSWPQIRLIDSAGNSGVLYLAPLEEGHGDFELPPLPPAGVFDVRFGSGRYVEKLDGGRCEIKISSAQYPLKIKAENLKERVLNVKDGAGGKVLNVTLEDGREISIAAPLSQIFLETLQTPLDYSLSQNFPNPFNPSTTIKFSLPQRARVKITVYNILGEKIAVLVDQELAAGRHKAEFNARPFASGVYFFTMESGNFRDYKKLVIAK